MRCSKSRRTIYIMLLIFSTMGAGLRCKGESATTELRPLYDLMEKIRTYPFFSLDFKQEIVQLTAGQTIKAHGRVYIKNPNSFRWDYFSEPSNTIACNGKTVVMILPEDRQAMVDSFDLQPLLWSPFALLTDSGKLETDFIVKPVDSSDRLTRSFQLKPVTKNSRYQHLIIRWIPTSSPFAFSLIIFDMTGNENRMHFKDMKPVTDSVEFLPVIPDGYQITDFSGQPKSSTGVPVPREGV
jgi:outer membrane lipoprotein-sorting protein